MSVLGRWTGGNPGIPTEAWASPNGLFTTQARNDGSVYSYASATARLTLPATIPAEVQGYLIVARVHMTMTHNNRHTQQGRFTLNSGTGNLLSSTTGSYSRNTNNNENFVVTWAVVDNPSDGYSLDYEWKRDTGDGTVAGSVTACSLDVIPLSYSDIAMYSSDSILTLDGTTPNILPLSGTVLEGTNITRTGNVITVTGDNKRYLVLGSNSSQGRNGRTQRWIGGYYDGALDRGAMGCLYHRDEGTDHLGGHFSDVIETATASRTISQAVYRGDGVANNQGGAEAAGTAPATGAHTMCVIELNDSCEVIRSSNAGAAAQSISGATQVDLNIRQTTDFADTASFTAGATPALINVVPAADLLGGANIGGASTNVASGVRYEGRGNITVNGVQDAVVDDGNYMRGLQATTDTFGYSVNPLGFVAVAAGDDVGIANTRNGGDAGTIAVQPAWGGTWFINLDTMAVTETNNVSELPSASVTVTPNTPQAATTELNYSQIPAATLTVVVNAPTVVATENITAQLPPTVLSLTPSVPTATSTENKVAGLPRADVTLVGNAPSVEATEHHRAQPPEAAILLTAYAPTVVAQDNHFSELSTANLVLAANAPLAISAASQNSELPSVSLTLAPYVVQVVTTELTNGQDVIMSAASLALTSYAPQAETTELNISVLPQAALSLNANAPTIVTTTDSEAIQEGYRWRNDDGTEISASWIDVQDTPVVRNKLTNTRLRVTIDYTGDPAGSAFTLQYKKTTEPASAWRDVEDTI